MILVITANEPGRIELHFQAESSVPSAVALISPAVETVPHRRSLVRLAGATLKWTGGLAVVVAAVGCILLTLPAGHFGAPGGASAASWKTAALGSADAVATAPGEMPAAMRQALAATPSVSPAPGPITVGAPPHDDPLAAFGLER